MKQETVQKLLDACEDMGRQLGSANYDGMREWVMQRAPLIRLSLDFLEKAKTRSELSAWMASKEPEPEPELVEFILRLFHDMPGILGNAIREAAKDDTLPSASKGRHPISRKKAYEICTFVLDLHGKKGVRTTESKARAARHFAVGKRSVDRIWEDREKVLKDDEVAKQFWQRLGEIVQKAKTSETPSGKQHSETDRA